MDLAAVKTYRYVRLAIVAAVAMLAIGVVVQVVRDGTALSSISAYYFTPMRDVFVGAILAGSLGLIAVRGRAGWENVLLDLAGLLLPVVAFLPVPLPGMPAGVDLAPFTCPDGRRECVPPEAVPAVETGLTTLLVVTAVVLGFAAWTSVRQEDPDPAERRGLLAATVVWLVVAVLFWSGADAPGRDLVLRYGHYTAAVSGFAVLVAVARINAARSQDSFTVRGRTLGYGTIYRGVWMLMALVLAGGLAAGVLVDRSAVPRLILWLEASLLALFAVFWTAQTVEFWRVGLPEPAADGSVGRSAGP